jgi:hypothetical protein
MILKRVSREQCVAAALVGTVLVLVAFASGLGITSPGLSTAQGQADPGPTQSSPATPTANGAPVAFGPIDGGPAPINYTGAAPSGSAPVPSNAPTAAVSAATAPGPGRTISSRTSNGGGATTPAGSPPTGHSSPSAVTSAGCPSTLLNPLIGPLLPSLDGLPLFGPTTGPAGSGSSGLLTLLPVLPSPALPLPTSPALPLTTSVPQPIRTGADPALGLLAGLPAQCLTAISALVSATAGGS